jgi:hypothetical protein
MGGSDGQEVGVCVSSPARAFCYQRSLCVTGGGSSDRTSAVVTGGGNRLQVWLLVHIPVYIASSSSIHHRARNNAYRTRTHFQAGDVVVVQ